MKIGIWMKSCWFFLKLNVEKSLKTLELSWIIENPTKVDDLMTKNTQKPFKWLKIVWKPYKVKISMRIRKSEFEWFFLELKVEKSWKMFKNLTISEFQAKSKTLQKSH